MQKNVAFYSNAVANIFLKNGYIVTLIVKVCHAMCALIFFFSFLFNDCPMRTFRLELQLGFSLFSFFFKMRSQLRPCPLYDCNERRMMSVNRRALGQS